MKLEDLKDAVIGETTIVHDTGQERLFMGHTPLKDRVLTWVEKDKYSGSLGASELIWWKIKQPEPEPYYFWELYGDDGYIERLGFALTENGESPDGCVNGAWKAAIKRVKISEAVYPVRLEE